MDDEIKLMFDFEDVFSDVISTFDPCAPTSTCDVGPATSALGTPNPLAPSQQDPVVYVPVSPTSSCNGLDIYAAATTPEQIKISEMASFRETTCVSPSPRAEPPAKPTKSKHAASSNKKRRHSAIQTESADEEDEAIQEQRRQRNRDHARKSRLRKKSLTGSLQNSLEELKIENAKLREQIYAAIGKNKTETMVKASLASPTENFIAALKKPENRVLGAETLSSLQGLTAKISPPNDPVQIVA